MDTRQRKQVVGTSSAQDSSYMEKDQEPNSSSKQDKESKDVSWRRILLLIIAITIHNIPGLSMGVTQWSFDIGTSGMGMSLED